MRLFWALLFACGAAGWSGLQLWRAATLGRLRAGRTGEIEWATAPITFWAAVAVYVIFFATFGGILAFIVGGELLRLISN